MTEDQPEEVLPVPKAMVNFPVVAMKTGHTETGTAGFWKIMMTCFHFSFW